MFRLTEHFHEKGVDVQDELVGLITAYQPRLQIMEAQRLTWLLRDGSFEM